MLEKAVKLVIALPFVSAAIFGLFIAGVAVYEDFKSSENRDHVTRSCNENDPAQMELSTGANKFIRRTILPDGTETGIIQTAYGNEVKYWFRSHHLSNDLGTSRFVFPDGRERTISGYFCCEVMFPHQDFKSPNELDSFLTEIDGMSP